MAPGVGGKMAVLRALLVGLCLCACDGSAKPNSGLVGGAGTGANQTCGSRCKPCDFASDCDQGRSRGGYACNPVEMRDNKQIVQGMTRTQDEARLQAVPMSSLSAEDAGADLDAGPVVDPQHRAAPPRRGVCSATCDSNLCTDPGMVCSSPTGFCHEGCDKKRPTCQGDQVCDFSKQACYALKGECKSASDCPIFDERLTAANPTARGTVSCEDQRCRYTPNPPDLNAPVQTTLALDTVPQLRVDSPQPGERISPSALPSYKFQFAAPAQVIVATILKREPKSLEDGASAAVWTAYLDGQQALNGVTLEQGGEMLRGEWKPYLGTKLSLPHQIQLYFLVIGYTRGERVGQSMLVPFTVGERRPEAGDECLGKDGDFCTSDSALLCMEGTCHTPCLSDADCTSGGSCDAPEWLGVAARVCR